MAKNKRYGDVSQMIRETSDSQDFSEAFEKQLAERQLMKQLLLVRMEKGLSQEDVAKKMGCTQSKVSKLESSKDGDIQMDDLVKYSTAIGLRPQFMFFTDVAAANMIKHHFFETKALLQKLVDVAKDDPVIAKGVGHFCAEAIVNYFKMLAESADALPKDVKSDIPLIRLVTGSPEALGHDENDESDEPKILANIREKVAV